jgi:hypothetical protein
MVAEVRRLHGQGMTQRKIAAALNEAGYCTFKGTTINSGQVCRMLGSIERDCTLLLPEAG